MKVRAAVTVMHLSSIKVWSIPVNTPNFNQKEYRTRFTKDHLFLTDNIEIYNKDRDMFAYTTIYLNENQFPSFQVARKGIVRILNEIALSNSDFWLGNLAKKALEDYSTMEDDLESARNVYSVCDPDNGGSMVCRFMQIDICRKMLNIVSNKIYHYTWLPNDDGCLNIMILGRR